MRNPQRRILFWIIRGKSGLRFMGNEKQKLLKPLTQRAQRLTG
jgi:hypothetical protein